MLVDRISGRHARARQGIIGHGHLCSCCCQSIGDDAHAILHDVCRNGPSRPPREPSPSIRGHSRKGARYDQFLLQFSQCPNSPSEKVKQSFPQLQFYSQCPGEKVKQSSPQLQYSQCSSLLWTKTNLDISPRRPGLVWPKPVPGLV